MPKVSVIIPTYNCAEYISDAIDSVLKQTYSDYEIFVVDDGSTDKTKEVLKKYNNIIKYFYQDNQGPGIARNRAIENSTGEYIAFLDADDMWFPDRLAIGVKILDEEPEIGLVHGYDINIMGNGKLTNINNKNKKRFLSGYIADNLLLRKIHINGGTVLFRRECIGKIGYLDDNLSKIGLEDRDLWYRIAREYKVKFVDKPLAYYRIRKNSLSKNYENMMKARYYLVNKYYPEGIGNSSIRKKIFSSMHMYFADGFSWRGKFHKATKDYLISIKYYPLNLKSYLHLIKALIKKFIYGFHSYLLY